MISRLKAQKSTFSILNMLIFLRQRVLDALPSKWFQSEHHQWEINQKLDSIWSTKHTNQIVLKQVAILKHKCLFRWFALLFSWQIHTFLQLIGTPDVSVWKVRISKLLAVKEIFRSIRKMYCCLISSMRAQKYYTSNPSQRRDASRA